MLASGKLSDFTCKHIDLANQKVQPIYKKSFSEDEVDSFTPDKSRRIAMKGHQRHDMPTVVKLSDRSYAVMGADSTSAPMGYVHVTLNATKKILQCTSDSCTRRHERLKHGGQLLICTHIHYVLLARRINEGIQPQPRNANEVCNLPGPGDPIERVQNRPDQLSWKEDLEETNLQRSSTIFEGNLLNLYNFNISLSCESECSLLV